MTVKADVKSLQRAAALTRRGKAAEAKTLLEGLIAEHPEDSRAHGLLGMAAEALGDREAALGHLARAVEIDPAETVSTQNYGALLVEAGRYADALPHLVRAAEAAPERSSAAAAVGRCHHKLGARERAVEWGQRCLELRAGEVDCPPEERIPAERPKPFDPTARTRNVIAYSIFGNDQYYWKCAITVARMAPAIFPEFTPRFYCGQETPKTVLDSLAGAGAQVRIAKGRLSNWDGLFWRFWAFDDPDVDYVLVRDVDSPLTARERVAVEEWLDGDLPFHVLRDNPLHAEPIMAGLWGGATGLLPELKPLCEEYLKSVSWRFADQEFLRHNVWPLIQDATLSHDSCYRLGETKSYPPYARVVPPIHVGWSWPRGPAAKARSVV